MNKLYILIPLIAFFCSSCSFTDNEELNAFYLDVPKPVLSTVYEKEGYASHNIKHIWLTTDNRLIGIFPVPGLLPIRWTKKETNVQFSFGVNDSGDNDSSIEYPFYEPVSTIIVSDPGEIKNLPITFKYNPKTVFDINEDFEKSNHIFTQDLDGNNNTKIKIVNTDKAGGQKSGLIELNVNNRTAEFSTPFYFNGKANKQGAVYFEFDYKSDEDILIGYEIVNNKNIISEYKIGMKKSATWKRAYINFSEEISKPNVEEYKIILRTTYSGKEENPKIFIDNVKLLHF